MKHEERRHLATALALEREIAISIEAILRIAYLSLL